jgi:hypothetical protein
MIKKTLPFLLLIALLWAACSKGSAGVPKKNGNQAENAEVIYSDPQRSFSCSIPGSWGVDETEAGGIYSTVNFHSPGQTSTIRIERYIKGTVAGNDTPKEYIRNRRLNAMEPGTGGYFHERPFPLRNKKGFHFVTVEAVPQMPQPWNGTKEEYGTKTTALRDEEVVLPDTNGFYVIAYICDPKINCNQETVFQNVVKTFKVNEPKR